MINYLKPDIIIKGGDWPEDKVVGRDEVKKWGGRVILIPEVEGKSTTDIVEKIKKLAGEGIVDYCDAVERGSESAISTVAEEA